jgi:hypothetical protein
MKVYLRSLKRRGEVGTGHGEAHVMGEVDSIAPDGENYIATIEEHRYSAIWNPFVSAYFVDDVGWYNRRGPGWDARSSYRLNRDLHPD